MSNVCDNYFFIMFFKVVSYAQQNINVVKIKVKFKINDFYFNMF